MSLMFRHVSDIETYFAQAGSLAGRIELATQAMAGFGLTSLVYDYTPVKYAHGGELITPSYLSMRNLPRDMASIWCDEGYYQIDPVQQLAFRSSAPFVWCYRSNGRTRLNRFLGDCHAPVIDYVHDSRITSGMTVPVHLPDGACATVTGICQDAADDFEREAGEVLAAFGLFAHVMHEALQRLFDDGQRRSRGVQLTPRERECVRFSADGLSAKAISARIDRAVPTVEMHLKSAARKLGARNRAQLIARAAHYGLLT